jgi:alginate O-acetyltransferase complex protein AlgI
MLFSSPLFLFLFLPVVLAVYLALPRRLHLPFLLAASLAYYAWSARSNVLILLLAIPINYGLALLVHRASGPGRAARVRRLLLLTTVAFDLALIVGSRVPGFFASVFAPSGLRLPSREAPIGISFFALALISYAIDTHNRKTPPARNLLTFAAWVSLFPKIVAGPIARYRDVAGQMAEPRPSRSDLARGVERFIVGLAKKVLIADTVAIVADEVFSLPAHNLTAGVAWLGVICYGLQIYFDFSGYSDMAIGLGRMFGIEFLENFNYPYISRSLGEFWRRWHISLSSWLRDYLFLPLAYTTSRKIKVERWLRVKADLWAYAVATFTTMLLCGLWHRAAWGCAIWGLWHGLFLTLENTRKGKRFLRRAGSPVRLLLTQWVVLMGWVFFRAASFGTGVSILRAMYGGGAGGVPEGGVASVAGYLNRPLLLGLCVGLPLCAPIGPAIGRLVIVGLRGRAVARPWIEPVVPYVQVLLLVGLLVASALALASGTYSPFVYQQF